jgi:hypothetical protein
MLKRIALAVVAAAFVLVASAGTAQAAEKFLGKVVKIEQTGKTALATLKDDAGQTVVLTVEDKVTLDKFADKRISVGDEIKAKYEVKDGKNVSTYFKKPGGC